MRVLFLRHAEAEDFAASDHARQLTAKGVQQAEKVAAFCLRAGCRPSALLSSPVVRARQTAAILADRLENLSVEHCAWLACGMRPETFLEEIRPYRQLEEIVVVGHEPDFGWTIASLIGCENGPAIHVRKASLTCVRLDKDLGGAILEFSIPVRLM